MNPPESRGAETRGGWGDISPKNLSMVYICIPSNNLTLVCIWAQVSTWVRGKKRSNFGEDLFFVFGLHLNSGKKVFHFWWWSSLNFQFAYLKKNRCRGSSPPMLKIGKNWGKIANYPPPQCSTKICTPAWKFMRWKYLAKIQISIAKICKVVYGWDNLTRGFEMETDEDCWQ